MENPTPRAPQNAVPERGKGCLFFYIYFWERESRAGAEREGVQRSLSGFCADRLTAANLTPGLKFTNRAGETMTWAQVEGSTDSATQCPRVAIHFKEEEPAVIWYLKYCESLVYRVARIKILELILQYHSLVCTLEESKILGKMP